MQRILILLLTGSLVFNVCQAQFSASGGANGEPCAYVPAAGTGLDKVFVFNGMSNAKLTFATGDPADWSWYRFVQSAADAVSVPSSDVQATPSGTVLNNVQSGYGYMVVSGGGARRYVYVVAYTPVNYKEIKFVANSDPCNTVTLLVSADEGDLSYYTVTGVKRKLDRMHRLAWNTLVWDAANKKYVTTEESVTASDLSEDWSVTAPLTDTYFTVSGDQYADSLGLARVSFKSALYRAVAVKANAEAVIQPREATNELDKTSPASDLSGSAPLDIKFFSHPSEAVQFYEWYVYESADGSGNYTRYTDEDILHSFQKSGTSMVKLYVSNSTCSDSAIFNPKVSESYLDCPNFFTPRSSPGENDEFKVAYRSIVSFKGTIVNRWGNVLFEWTDPSVGWNGTYKGKAVSPGVYFYLIEARGSDGIVYKKKGDINLLE